MLLPLIQRAREDGVKFALTSFPRDPATDQRLLRHQSHPAPSLIPQRELRAGEQYRFHFDMGQCIGCKCCVVACNEQNGNPPDINWRRVGEIEGGSYPNTRRFHISMGCNHCVEPSCLIGCPVDAYKKDEATGIVLHSAEACIGCQYCTWNCSYGVPQYNPERGVVGKCDMCYGRLTDGREPACVTACPQGAIRIEIVNVAEWKQEYENSANAPGLPSAGDSVSTTRISLPGRLPRDTKKADFWRVKPEAPHWPLIVMTVLTQLSVGALAVVWLVQMLAGSTRLGLAAMAALAVGGLALGASALHLGRPVHAYRALKMWRRSWLSREILLFCAFSTMASLYVAALWWKLGVGALLGLMTCLFGVAGVEASSRIYRVTARPAWNSAHTSSEFFLTGALLGPLFAASVGVLPGGWLAAPVTAASLLILNQAAKFLRLTASESFEMQASAQLLSTRLKPHLLLRGALTIGGGILLPLAFTSRWTGWAAFGAAFAGEVLGRYLFFVSVVSKNMAASYLTADRQAA